MRPREIFQLAIRLLGLLFLYHGLSVVPSLIQLILAQSASVGTFIYTIFVIGWNLAVAWWLIGGAALLMRHAYGTAVADG